MDRVDVTFSSAGTRCAAWLYRPADTGRNVPCVVMAHGMGLTRRDGLVGYAQELAAAGAGVVRALPFWRPVAHARKLACPTLIQAGDRDISVSARAIERMADRAPNATLKRYDVDHFQPIGAEHSVQIIADQIDWLRTLR